MFIVIASKTHLQAGTYTDCIVQADTAQIPTAHVEVYKAATEADCEQWARYHEGAEVQPARTLNPSVPVTGGNSSAGAGGSNGGAAGAARLNDVEEEPELRRDPRYFWLYVLQYGVITVVALAFVSIIGYGIYSNSYSDDEKARGLITFLIAVSTVGIATLTLLTAMLLRDFKERFASAKEVLTVLVGILGTIVGFYYGQAASKEAATKTTVNDNTNKADGAQVKDSNKRFDFNPLTENQNSNIKFKLADGKPHYHYRITVTPATSINAIESDLDTGEIHELFKATLPANTSTMNFTVEDNDHTEKPFKTGSKGKVSEQ
jgi:uncharacterized membrane protein YhaH (DUF805 family)